MLLALALSPGFSCATDGFLIRRTEDFELTITFQGRFRDFQVHVPEGYTGTHAVPVMLVLHGSGSSGSAMRLQTGMDSVSDRMGFIAVYPDGEPAWAFPGSELAERGFDDVAFFDDLIDRLGNLVFVDEDRVYVTGFSNGGYMTQALGCALPGRLAAIAPVAGSMTDEILAECQTSLPLAVLMVHGTLDASVPFDGEPDRGLLSVDASLQFWARRAGCQLTPTVDTLGIDTTTNIVLRRERYPRCGSGTSVVLHAFDGGRHQWFATPLSASQLVAEFLLQHRR